MIVTYIPHARKRMEEYHILEEMVLIALQHPDAIEEGRFGRKIYQRKLNGHILRIIVECEADIKRVITVYNARSMRYGL